MKKIVIILFVLISYVYSENIYFSQNSLNTNELEAKIISKIASDLLIEPKIYLVGHNEDFEKYISKNFELCTSCDDANFVYIKKDSNFDLTQCTNKNKIFFTDDKYEFRNNPNIFGAFFWLKSRPNVRISSKKAKDLDIVIPTNYIKFLDEE